MSTLQLIVVNDRYSCSGEYEVVEGEAVNGYPLWRAAAKPRWIYSTQDPSAAWHVTDDRNDFETGQALICTMDGHRGKPPYNCSRWASADGKGGWAQDRNTIVRRVVKRGEKRATTAAQPQAEGPHAASTSTLDSSGRYSPSPLRHTQTRELAPLSPRASDLLRTASSDSALHMTRLESENSRLAHSVASLQADCDRQAQKYDGLMSDYQNALYLLSKLGAPEAAAGSPARAERSDGGRGSASPAPATATTAATAAPASSLKLV
eukprot:gene20415-31421_t